MPPSNSNTIRATVTTRWTVTTGTRPRAGTRSEATAAASRKIAGAGTRNRWLSRLDKTASSPAPPTTAIARPKPTTSFIAEPRNRDTGSR
jgi:hypothetical protein